MKNKFFVTVLTLTILASFFSVVPSVLAQPSGGTGNLGTGGTGNLGGGGIGNPGCGGGSGVLPNPFKGGCSLYELLEAIIQNILLPIGAVLAVLAFIYSGFLYVTARGNTTKIKTAHRALLYSAIGTAILLGAWAIAKVIQNTIGNILNS